MRPLRLSLEGFTSYRSPTVVEFGDAEYFALVGPTGSGKSSLIDAMVFALYGSIPRYDHQNLVAPLISQGLVEARVGLEFAVGADRYRAVRVVRATGKRGGATTKEARLERVSDDQVLDVLAGDASGVSTAVTALLGLTFDQFTKCVVLPQGAFARFLHDKPSERQDLLIRLLGLQMYGDVGQRANHVAVVAKERCALALDALQRPPVAEATADAVAAAAVRTDELDRLRATLAAAEPALVEAAREQSEAEAASALAEQRAQLLRAVTVPDDAASVAASVQQARAAEAEAQTAIDHASAVVVAIEAEIADLPPRATLERARDSLSQQQQLRERLAKGDALIIELGAAEQAARRRFAAADHHLAEARSAVDAAGQAHRAAQLARDLVAGQPCPVCEQVVVSVPVRAGPDLRPIETAMAEAQKTAADADHQLQSAVQQRASAQARRDALAEQLQELEAGVADGFGDEGAVTAALDAVTEAERRLAQARRGEREQRAAHKAASSAREAAEDRLSEGWRAFDRARDAVASLGPPQASRADLLVDWQALVAWAADRLPAEEHGAAEATARAAAAAHRQDEQRAQLEKLCAGAGVELDGGRSLVEAVAEARANAAAVHDRLKEALVEGERLRAEVAASEGEARVARTLAQHLRSTAFEKWVLDEVVAQLVDGATEVLRQLSGGAYSLALDGAATFAVIDHANADARRLARTLSGGETFLASLALALALADRLGGFAADGAAPVDAIFLDEGFGSLDLETLDTVASAMENLAATGRVVGIVTHVPELAERVPVRFEVRRQGASSTVERVEG